MDEVLYLQSLAELKAISNPYRMAILKLFGVVPDEPLSGKMIAERLGEPTSKIHYHLKELEKIQVIRIVKTKEINGILEKFYLPTAKNITIHKDLLSSEVKNSALVELLFDLLDHTKNQLLQIQQKKLPWRKASGSTGVIYLTLPEAEELHDEIKNLIKKHENPKKDTHPYELLTLLYPQITKPQKEE